MKGFQPQIPFTEALVCGKHSGVSGCLRFEVQGIARVGEERALFLGLHQGNPGWAFVEVFRGQPSKVAGAQVSPGGAEIDQAAHSDSHQLKTNPQQLPQQRVPLSAQRLAEFPPLGSSD